MKLSDIPIFIFELEERTKVLSKYCFEKLGFKKIIILDHEESFSKKMERFFEMTQLEEYKDCDLFIRTDADRLVFEGIKELAEKSIEVLKSRKDGLLLSEGHGYECFMSRFRGATPHVYSKNLINHVLQNKNKLVKNIQKPESHIGIYCKKELNCFYFFNILTNLHEFEQYPSKMFNAFLNRMHRGHLGYYDVDAILNNEYYGPAMQLALNDFKQNPDKKLSLSYSKKDLEILINKDNKLGEINKESIELIFEKYKSDYNMLNTRYKQDV
jgi:hypothetical protein